MLGLVFVVSSVDVGLWQLLFVPLIGQNYLGWDPANFIPALGDPFSAQIATGAYWVQAIAIAIILGAQALLNHIGIRATTLLTDLSGYLIIVVAVILTIAMLASAPEHRYRPPLHLHQQHRRCRRRRVAAERKPVLCLPAGAAAARLYGDGLRCIRPHVGGNALGGGQCAEGNDPIRVLVVPVRLRHDLLLRAGDADG